MQQNISLKASTLCNLMSKFSKLVDRHVTAIRDRASLINENVVYPYYYYYYYYYHYHYYYLHHVHTLAPRTTHER